MRDYPRKQSGMVLLVSLTLLLLLSVLGLTSLQSAVQQEKMAGSVWFANQSLQAAETGLRMGEAQVQTQWRELLACSAPTRCVPPSSARTQVLPGLDPQSGVLWLKAPEGVFGLQSIGAGVTPAHWPGIASAHFYRVTAVGVRGPSRTVLESVYVRYQPAENEANEPVRQQFRRIMWRQIQ
ncbi:PilX N-terminal domain-containing pilus assembly protein [Pseudomonas helleri]|jgi:type IV pilus assembly protein PilX|uniref:pilus assembly PilX family protein n=1 Tax=Pseudomonas helleri TaxID=1608996 RepID=UPI002F354868